MTACVIIPARLGSTRFPAKILAAETGKPLVQHVVEQARKCRLVRDVIVAADHERIAEELEKFGTRVVLTSPNHQSGTDRIAEVARSLDHEVVVNVQGDEPEIEPSTIDNLIEVLQRGTDDMATAATQFPEHDDPSNPNLVKVVISPAGHAIYFSRSAIPYHRDTGVSPVRGVSRTGETPVSLSRAYYLHLGIYAYRRKFLLEYASWPPTPLEQVEKLEQLRALEHGKSIYVLKINRAVHGIDTAEQYREFVERSRQQAAGSRQ